MTPLLGRESFPGEWISAERAGASWVGEAWFDGVLVWTTWTRAEVAEMLPPGWIPARSTSDANDEHPVVFAIGRQRNTAVLFGGLSLPSDADYDEAMIAVPFVRHEAGRHLHTYVPRMYATDARAIWAGNTYYGFGKRMATFERLGRTLAVSDERGLVLQALSTETRRWPNGANSTDLPMLVGLHEAFRLPILGVTSDGREIASYFDWGLDDRPRRLLDVVVMIEATLAAGLAPRTCTAATDAAVQVRRMRWRLTWPGPCRR
jgi:hypothetical protein